MSSESIFRRASCVLLGAVFYGVSFTATGLFAQGGLQIPGQTGGQTGFPTGQTGGTNTGMNSGQGQNTGSNQGGGRTSNVTQPGSNGGTGMEGIPNTTYIPAIADNRNQGFVGATAQRVQDLGFVGSASNRSGPRTVSGQTWGGGVNSSAGGGSRTGGGGMNTGMGARTGGIGGTTGGGLGARTGQMGGLGGGGLGGFGGFGGLGGLGGFGQNMFGRGGFGGQGNNQNFVQTNQGGLRAAVNPVFMTNPSNTGSVASDQVGREFQASFSRQPANQNFVGQYQVQMDGTTAVLRGRIGSKADADRLISQLRLQPGVYKIENQLEVDE